ncbi:MAG: hypothetical protein ACPGWS_10470 [Solirubrobacterales bacterium]
MSDELFKKIEADLVASIDNEIQKMEEDLIEKLAAEIEAMSKLLRRLNAEGRLDCVVAGETTQDGRRASLCTQIIRNPDQMCAGCAARV